MVCWLYGSQLKRHGDVHCDPSTVRARPLGDVPIVIDCCAVKLAVQEAAVLGTVMVSVRLVE